jgi:hypothetical protein
MAWNLEICARYHRHCFIYFVPYIGILWENRDMFLVNMV